MLEPSFLRWGVGIACAYEVVALATGRVPTISSVANEHPWFGATIIGGLTWHFLD